jgi:hypothetical protein
MEKTYKYIHMSPAPGGEELNGKPIYGILNNKSGDPLGYLWYDKKWKQYIFEGIPECIFSTSCIEDILDFMNIINAEKPEVVEKCECDHKTNVELRADGKRYCGDCGKLYD